MFVVAFLSFLLVGVLAVEDQSGQCFSRCADQNTCGVWLENAQESKSGLYSLKNNRLNLTCSFVSLPTTIQIQWKFKQKGGNQWTDANCTQYQEQQCNATVLNEHRTRAFCLVEQLALENTGAYRCQTKFQDEPSYSAESVIEVIGIGKQFGVVDKKLVLGQPGFIEIEICANPLPQIFFVNDKHVLQPGDVQNNYALTSLGKSRQNAAKNDEPSEWHSFCYNSRLLIGSVNSEDVTWRVTALIADDTQTIKLVNQLDNGAKSLTTLSLLILFANILHFL